MLSTNHGAVRVRNSAGGGVFAIDVHAGGSITNCGVQAAAIVPVTDSTGGAASDTFAAITAGASYAQADAVAIKNALASIAAKQNAILAALQGVGILP
jgi:hypothetical protein